MKTVDLKIVAASMGVSVEEIEGVIMSFRSSNSEK